MLIVAVKFIVTSVWSSCKVDSDAFVDLVLGGRAHAHFIYIHFFFAPQRCPLSWLLIMMNLCSNQPKIQTDLAKFFEKNLLSYFGWQILSSNQSSNNIKLESQKSICSREIDLLKTNNTEKYDRYCTRSLSTVVFVVLKIDCIHSKMLWSNYAKSKSQMSNFKYYKSLKCDKFSNTVWEQWQLV